jgi:hypothetical protein
MNTSVWKKAEIALVRVATNRSGGQALDGDRAAAETTREVSPGVTILERCSNWYDDSAANGTCPLGLSHHVAEDGRIPRLQF